ncbi:hypothetical protein [Arthrobacter sp. A5]
MSPRMEFDEVVETISGRLEVEAVGKCMGALTAVQREVVALAY